MSGETQYWLVAQGGLTADRMPAYLAEGRWTSRNLAGHAKQLASMRPGDRVALKSTGNRTTGVPFFNADRVVSVMTIHALGTIRSVDPATGTVEIDWTSDTEPREWYLWTYVHGLAQIVPDGGVRSNLIDWLFNGAEQDLAAILPEWADRYPKPPGFTWIPWYEEFATALLKYRNDRSPVLSALLEMAETEPLLKQLMNDVFADGTTGPMRDVDPFTVFGTFNRWLTDENRQHLIQAFARRFGVSAAIPQDFDSIPLLNNQKSWFVSYDAARGPGDIDALWRVFAAGLAFAGREDSETRAEFVAAFDAAQAVKGVKWNLSTGLFWCRPNTFPTLDSRSRDFNIGHFRIGAALDGAGYLATRDELLRKMADGSTSITSFPLLSYAAWSDSTAVWLKHSHAGFASWGARMAESVDLDDIEHDFKRKTAALLREARSQIDAGNPDWTATFRRGLASTNTLDHRFKDDLGKGIAADPGAAADLFKHVWSNPRPESLDELHAGLAVLIGKVTPGNATALGAALLMAVDVDNNAPYSPSRVEKWHRLTRTEGLDWTAKPSRRYADMLAWLDALAGHLEGPSGDRSSRLETQGIAWATTEQDIPAQWSEAERKVFAAWRSHFGEPPRAWLVRARHAAVSDWIEDSYVSLAATNLGEVAPGSAEKAVKAAVEKGYQHVGYPERKALTAEYHAFLTLMKVGDLVAAQQNTTIHIGVIEGDPEYSDEPGDRLRRRVAWRGEVETDDAGDLRGLLDLQGTVVDITQGLDILVSLITPGPGPVIEDEEEVVVPRVTLDVVPLLPRVTPDVAARLHIGVPHLQEIVDLLQSRQQIVLFGPPGTGKTYIAMALARHVVGPERSRVQLVQFHPSYAYEDFFEGFRPKETDQGQATFELTPGPLRRIAAAAAGSPGTPFVLVIDELNRANLAKVFGELYFLLEYRKESIALQYSPTEAFRLPPNLFFIGTMNTADRSIALLDAAMRRRFSFVELHPDEPPVRDVLVNWLSANHQPDERAKLLQALNAAIEEQDRDMRIGPSYLMRPEAATQEGLARVWKYDIMPLLEEHYYGRLTRDQIQARFGLEALRAGLAGAVAVADPPFVDDLS